MPRLSVVIPTWNRAAKVAEAIGSVRAQTMGDLEILVVDDGSTDETPDVLAALARDEPRLRILRQANAGPAAARNRGIDEARAPFVAFLDSDDLWEPSWATSQLGVFDADPSADLVLCDAAYVGDWPYDEPTCFQRANWRPPTNLEAMFGYAYGLPSCTCLRTDVARALRFDVDLGLAEDTEMLFRFHLAGHRLRVNPAVLTSYRAHAGAAGAPQLVADERALRTAHFAVLERHREHAPDPKRLDRHLARRRALLHVEAGAWTDARPHLARWWRLQPTKWRAFRLYVRSLLASSGAR